VVGLLVLGVGAAVFAVGSRCRLGGGFTSFLEIGSSRFRRRSRCRRLGGGFTSSSEMGAAVFAVGAGVVALVVGFFTRCLEWEQPFST
jgi:hypothetical protein